MQLHRLPHAFNTQTILLQNYLHLKTGKPSHYSFIIPRVCSQINSFFFIKSLYLDIWAPEHANKDSGLPVKVWIFGGSETEGSISDPLYDGCNSEEDDSILVTINYRVGPLGFMALNSAGIYGNQGIQDLILGLKWIQDNIAAFGGDPVC